MSQIITFSVDKEFAGRLDGFIQQTGYNNRSLFLRDASIHFADVSIRGDLESIDENRHVEGTAVVYFQHNVEHKIAELRHSEQFQIILGYSWQSQTNPYYSRLFLLLYCVVL